MSFLDSILGNLKQKEDLQDFVNRYEQGPPEEGYSDQEVVDRFQQITPQIPNDVYMQAAEQAFARLTPEQRLQFAQNLQQQASQQGLNYPDLNRPGSEERFQDPGYLAQVVSDVRRQQPDLLTGLLGGGRGGRGGRGGGSRAPEQDLLGNPVAKAAIAGIAALAVKHLMQRGRGRDQGRRAA